VDDLLVGKPAKDLGNLSGPQAPDPADVLGRVVGQPSGEFTSVTITEGDQVALVELANNIDDSGGQKALAAFFDGLAGSGVDDDAAAGLDAQPEPPFAGLDGGALGEKERTHRFAGDDFFQCAGLLAGGDDGVSAGGGDDLRGPELAFHASLAEAGFFVADEGEHRIVDFADEGDELRLGVVGVAGEKAFHIGEEDEEVGLEEVGDEGCESIVIAEGHAQLLHGDGVVFVDDGDGIEAIEQGEEGVAGIEIAGAIFDDVGGEENLADDIPMVSEMFVVGLHEEALADGGDGLEVGQVGGSPGQPEPSHARPHCAGTDEGDFSAGGANGVNFLGELGDAFLVESPIGVSDDAGPHLDDEQFGFGGDLAPDEVRRGGRTGGSGCF